MNAEAVRALNSWRLPRPGHTMRGPWHAEATGAQGLTERREESNPGAMVRS